MKALDLARLGAQELGMAAECSAGGGRWNLSAHFGPSVDVPVLGGQVLRHQQVLVRCTGLIT